MVQKAQAILNALDSPDAELSIVIVDDVYIAALNKQYLNRSGPTNVIAFPMRAGDYSDIMPHLLGDVVISAETARQEANASGIRFNLRLSELMVHGVLHLFGYDHEKSDKESHRMQLKSDELLGIIEGLDYGES
ncbi:MAG: rRNA maturation RNase YbeY [Desulfobacterales bacterium]|nr:rRNA maturation RNase YbeY [Desulfobacterales bacterium]